MPSQMRSVTVDHCLKAAVFQLLNLGLDRVAHPRLLSTHTPATSFRDKRSQLPVRRNPTTSPSGMMSPGSRGQQLHLHRHEQWSKLRKKALSEIRVGT